MRTEDDDMIRNKHDLKGRRSMLVGLGGAAAGLTLGAATAQAQATRGASGFQPTRHELDAWMGEIPGKHRIFVDTSTADGGAEGLVYTNNLYDAQENAYAGTPADLAIIVCFRHFSTPFGYNDAIWEKYGETFKELIEFSDPDTGEAPTINLLNASDRTTTPNFGITIDSLVAKGTQIAICSAATRFLSSQLATQAGTSADEVYDELVAGALPGSRFVPAGVVALTRAQEYRYSVLIAG
jgi:hypothetical protein